MFDPKVFSEHMSDQLGIPDFRLNPGDPGNYYFPKKRDDKENPCYSLSQEFDAYRIKLSYYIGLDWISGYTHSIYVEPKRKGHCGSTDYVKMLMTVLGDAHISVDHEELFIIKFDEPFIDVQGYKDLLTPLLIIRFITVVKEIVRKALKRSYYRIQENLFCRVRGKTMVSDTIKRNVIRGRNLNTWCQFEVLDINGPENRLLKTALEFSFRYIQLQEDGRVDKAFFLRMFNYIMPAFGEVSTNLNTTDITIPHKNSFYKDYEEGTLLARIILRRFGFQISRVLYTDKVATPPFWIDMSKLFELFVLKLLRDRFPGQNRQGFMQVVHHYRANRNEPDYLIDTEEFQGVGDAKYKFQGGKIDDVRQVCGYSRLKSVAQRLRISPDKVINGFIFYFDPDDGVDSLFGVDLLAYPIHGFSKLYKVGIKLPTV